MFGENYDFPHQVTIEEPVHYYGPMYFCVSTMNSYPHCQIARTHIPPVDTRF